ncbi:MAG: hypothetical protein K9I37_00080 [Crocinitomicaceae bacterium]|nr:hypothetical protein [Crocinitomicaceae bacterium]
MKKTIIYLLIGIVSAFSIIALLVKSSNKKNKIELVQKRNINKQLVLIKSIKFENILGMMKKTKNDITFACFDNVDGNSIFYFDTIRKKIRKKIELNIPIEKIVVDNYFYSKHGLFIVNSINGTLLKISSDGNIIEKFTYPKKFFRVDNRDDLFLISGWDKNFNLFHEKFNFSLKKISKIVFEDDYLKKYKSNGIALDGAYFSNDYFTVNMPYSVNRIYIFNENFNYTNKMDLIYNPITFKIRNGEDGNIYPDPNNLNPNKHAYLDSTNIFYCLLNESTKWDKSNKCYIDIYDLKNKKYKESIKVVDFANSEPREIIVAGNRIYILFKSSLNIYLIKNK